MLLLGLNVEGKQAKFPNAVQFTGPPRDTDFLWQTLCFLMFLKSKQNF